MLKLNRKVTLFDTLPCTTARGTPPEICQKYRRVQFTTEAIYYYYYYYYYLLQSSFHSVAIVLTLVTNKNKYTEKKQYKNTVNTSTHITKTPTQLSKHPHITKPTHTHTHAHTYIHTYRQVFGGGGCDKEFGGQVGVADRSFVTYKVQGLL